MMILAIGIIIMIIVLIMEYKNPRDIDETNYK